ncbi:MAG: ATP-dependent RecD-like DNA helicase [Planctomycetes bacterium]|nr:ATP-dependent RecD-like DNA helicase [Planctomycetota bacterium]
MALKIDGIIERITFHNLDSGYVVLKVHVKGHRDLVTIVGQLSAAVAGEFVEAEGDWVNDREHGLQFKADTLRTTPPHTIAGITKYLGSGLIKGIGPTYAKRIVEIFGERTLDVIDKTPSHLSEIKGIGKQRLERIRKSWEEQRGVRSVMVFLQSYGIGTARAIRIYKTYGDSAVDKIKNNPYRLSADIWGIGFKIADDLAMRLNLPKDSPLRARAAVRYVLQECNTQGHVGFPEIGIIDRTVELTQITPEIIRGVIEQGRQEDEFVRDQPPVPFEPFGEEPWLFLKASYQAEVGIAKSIRLLRSRNHPLPAIDIEKALAWVEKQIGFELAASQLEAIRAATTEKVLVVTGGPGVGKTTIVKGIIEIFAAKKLKVALAAPTGRAAKRLSESTGREAKTIHRLLEFNAESGGFTKDSSEPIDAELLVVDEASMIDVNLMNQLLKAIPPYTCVIFVGDVDQLPSVGPGTVLADLIESNSIRVVRLTEIFRQAGQSWIIRAAHAINNGEEPESAPSNSGDFFFIEVDEPPMIIDRIVQMVRERIPARFHLDPLRDVQILTPMNKSEIGVTHLNQILQDVLNPIRAGSKRVERFGTGFREGDKVLQTVNNYNKEVFNGDIGRIVDIDETDQEVLVEIDGRQVLYDFSELDELVLAYATTIHKSQGSEYPAVIIPLHTQNYVMLQRNLLYTGVTRGKKLVVIVGSRKALRIAIQRQDTARRYSLLRWRLQEATTT